MTECAICKEKYDSNEKIPKILECGHTFCKNCLDALYTKDNNNFCCPKCRKKCSSGPEYLTTNYDILELDNNFEFAFNIGLIGDSGTGKTCIIRRFIENSYESNLPSTIGFEFAAKIIQIKSHKINLILWDTAGQERYMGLSKQFIRKLDGIFFVFDVCDVNTFKNIPNWIKHIEDSIKVDNIVLYLLGNKTDGQRKVRFEDAKRFADEKGMDYGETSALIGDNIKTSFYNMAGLIYEKCQKNRISDKSLITSIVLKNEEQERGCC